ncbi:MAG: F0F1 ATP synthase subunit epsilon [Thiobacillus sp. 63-78]|uniref:F0F1 ATP synthase subunit epsilon n=1 Tax=Thiobacillus sp. 63-78 TaxID=1895859 RepID=UPI00086DC1DA|nr:F0F1 ATP synthase subunit epsilon [Thiobacillus sp. 63-78]MBN8764412.1 F0F1 ATP synthase subunit epsilon [Thiobacillus sp.]ODV11061.1 MAG: F0F1 ATP synthase subunit epsilon [Thiobacillus sp. SCN 64-317]MBN8766123.1 F0F1 ATP synthase subunit epsilon [Thiobacillus sp.]MBN8772692.1 F0F1 ATP synthase subunit epsilon [Thiobacillus sp.]OJZ15568.1 MAG: F0F1 ATP synthase subunit epsilon [Thiobacillus sp. 63-78]
MAMTLHVDIVSAEKSLYSGTAEVVVAPGQRGELGIYPRHTPLLTTLKPGAVRIKVPNQAEEELVYVSGGILEVQPHVVTVLSDSAIRGADLDETKALEAKHAAEEAMKNKAASLDYAKAQIELAQAVAQLATIKKLRKLT